MATFAWSKDRKTKDLIAWYFNRHQTIDTMIICNGPMVFKAGELPNAHLQALNFVNMYGGTKFYDVLTRSNFLGGKYS